MRDCRTRISQLADQFNDLTNGVDSSEILLKDAMGRLEHFDDRLIVLENQEIEEQLNKMSHKMITDCVREQLTPIKIALNVDNKQLTRKLDDQGVTLNTTRINLQKMVEELDQVKSTTVFELQNTRKEKQAVARELERM